MDETSKTRHLFTALERSIIANGVGIDIGCGKDKIAETAIGFDLESGDANHISQYINKQFDYVYSSHCLEHMHNPLDALHEWWGLVKTGGYLLLAVPDEDLYEQGQWPSRFNSDHKWTFTISKNKSWSPKSINLFPVLSALPDSKLIKMELQDNDYDRSRMYPSFLSGKGQLRRLARHILKAKIQDQTKANAIAQIFCVVQKIA